MLWNESNRMDERIKFVARLSDGESMSGVCREFGISSGSGKIARFNQVFSTKLLPV